MHLMGASRKSMSTLQLARMPERGRDAGWSIHWFGALPMRTAYIEKQRPLQAARDTRIGMGGS
jgi:hypothetical protein